MNDTDNRISRLEFRADATDEGIKTLRENQIIFGNSLLAIEQTLMKIKYGVYGGGIIFAVSTMGLKEVILKLLHF